MIVIVLLVVPLQVSLVPLARLYGSIGLIVFFACQRFFVSALLAGSTE